MLRQMTSVPWQTMSVLPRAMRSRVWVFAHGREITADLGPERNALREEVLCRAPGWICLTRWLADALAARGVPAERIRVVPAAVAGPPASFARPAPLYSARRDLSIYPIKFFRDHPTRHAQNRPLKNAQKAQKVKGRAAIGEAQWHGHRGQASSALHTTNKRPAPRQRERAQSQPQMRRGGCAISTAITHR